MAPTRVDELLSRAIEADVAERRALREALAALGERLGALEARVANLESLLAEGVAALRDRLDALAPGAGPTAAHAGPLIDLSVGGSEPQQADPVGRA
jgi:hypothetical protein